MSEQTPISAARTARTLGWQSGSVAVQAVVNLLFYSVLMRFVTPAEYGNVVVGLVFVGLLTVLAEGGFAHVLVRLPNIDRAITAYTARWSILLGALLSMVAWLAAGIWAAMFEQGTARHFVQLLSPTILILGIAYPAQALLERELRFDALFKAQSISYVVGYGVVGIGASLLGFGVLALIAATLTRSVLFTALVVWQRPYPLWTGSTASGSSADRREVIRFGTGFVLTRLLEFISWQGDNVVVGRLLGIGALGIYQRAYELMEIPGRLLGKVLEKTVFATLARVQNDAARMRRGVEVILLGITLLAAPMACFVLLFSRQIVRVLYGNGWIAVAAPLAVFSMAIVFRTSCRMAESILRARGVVYRSAGIRFATACLLLGAAVHASGRGVTAVAAVVTAVVGLQTILLWRTVAAEIELPAYVLIRAIAPGLLLAGALTPMLALIRMLAHDTLASDLFALSTAGAAISLAIGLAIALSNDKGPLRDLKTMVSAIRSLIPVKAYSRG